MSEISVIGNAVAGAVQSAAETTPAPSTQPVEVASPATDSSATTSATDRVEFSQQAQMLETIQQLPDVRQERIDAIRDCIANNTYVTKDKLGVAFDRLIDEVNQ